MTTVQKTQSKAKQASKAPSKASKAPSKDTTATVSQWSIVAYIVAYIDEALQTKGETYYRSANSNHKATVFPRERNTPTRLELLKANEGDTVHARVKEIFKQHASGLLKSGNKDGQAVYDIYRMSK